MRGDEVHRQLLENGWRWERCESYAKTFTDCIIELRPNVKEFPAQRHVPWGIWVKPLFAGAMWEKIGMAREFSDLMIFTR